ncbi:unnamed protein product [Cylindrotheca closterium]|uniref:Methyltransferase domain-containing protein n=1 Tax=Cylindrotheca closterium TaxID=2856 RepID=A0AAD2FCM4_9STRA|nr:unnamed protein product [Cylindrotheca closterium]
MSEQPETIEDKVTDWTTDPPSSNDEIELSNTPADRDSNGKEEDQEHEKEIENTKPTISVRQMRKLKNPQRKRHGARNQHKNKIFVKWLIDRFHLKTVVSDEDPISSSPVVLDVAGGKGEVAARLTMCHLQKVVMVDPRLADVPHCFDTLVYPKIPNKWQKRLDDQRKENPNVVQDKLANRFQQLVTTFDEYTITSNPELQSAIQNATLILGLHADGATEAIVDAALQYSKPFCVVPCCVFPNLFRSRQVENEAGEMVPVRSHGQFCKYLADKDQRFQTEILPFDGRNVAIWWDGK